MIITSPSATELKAKLFRGMADNSRLRVLESLRSGPLSVSEIIDLTGLSQPNVSGHLNCLFDCGLVNREQHGRFVFYSLADPRVENLIAAAENLLTIAGDQVFLCTRYEASIAEHK